MACVGVSSDLVEVGIELFLASQKLILNKNFIFNPTPDLTLTLVNSAALCFGSTLKKNFCYPLCTSLADYRACFNRILRNNLVFENVTGAQTVVLSAEMLAG